MHLPPVRRLVLFASHVRNMPSPRIYATFGNCISFRQCQRCAAAAASEFTAKYFGKLIKRPNELVARSAQPGGRREREQGRTEKGEEKNVMRFWATTERPECSRRRLTYFNCKLKRLLYSLSAEHLKNRSSLRSHLHFFSTTNSI